MGTAMLFGNQTNHQLDSLNPSYSETSLIRQPSGPINGGLINEVTLLLKTSLMQPFNKQTFY